MSKAKAGKVENIGGSSNGRTVAFEAINWGSIPCPPAREKTPSGCFFIRAEGRKCQEHFRQGIEKVVYEL